MCTCVYKHNLLRSFSVAHMFGTELLGLASPSEGSSMEKTSPSLHSYYLPIALLGDEAK